MYFTTASSTALAPTQPPIQWVQGALSLGVKRPGREADHSPPSSTEVKECVELYFYSPNTPSWRGAQLKKAQGQLYLYLFVPVRKQMNKWNMKLVYGSMYILQICAICRCLILLFSGTIHKEAYNNKL
jgi:hypothetical protein